MPGTACTHWKTRQSCRPGPSCPEHAADLRHDLLLALLNDGAILSIAYGNVRNKMRPGAWNMRLVLGIATVLGVVGPIAAFGLFYLGDRVFDLGHPRVQTMMYLMLPVAGHLIIFLTRTRGGFWSIRSARILLLAVLGTQTIAALIAVYGLSMQPLVCPARAAGGSQTVTASHSHRTRLAAPHQGADPS